MHPLGVEPGSGRAFVGTAAASFATGPTLMVLAAVYDMIKGQDITNEDLSVLPSIMAYSVLICLVGSIPAAALNAVILGIGARKGVDAVWWAMSSGAMIGLLTAAILAGLFTTRSVDGELGSWFSATRALMGALHWYVAIRAHRRWHFNLLHDQEAIRAME